MKKLLMIIISIAVFALFAPVVSLPQAHAETAGNVYDISEVSTIAPGGELEFYGKRLMNGNKTLAVGDSVKFEYKIANFNKSVRSAVGIGSYGFYFYYNQGSSLTFRTCTFSGDGWGRGENVTVEENVSAFGEFVQMTLKTENTENEKIKLLLTYVINETEKTVSHEFDRNDSGDMLLHFGEDLITQYSEVYIKSTLPAATFGDGSFTYVNYNNNAGKNISGKCMLGVVGKENAEKYGVPEGYTGNVLKVEGLTPTGSLDMSFDFTSANISEKRINGIKFRIYIVKTSADNAKYPALRIPDTGSASSFTSYVIGANTDKWIDISFDKTQISKICTNGKLEKFTLWLRTEAATIMYVDNLVLDLVQLDEEAPVITAPITRFKVPAETYPLDDAVSATDNSGSITLSREWSENALDARGRLTAGTHTCKIIATDPSGNTSEITITYVVYEEPIAEKYTITFKGEGLDDVTYDYYEGGEDYVKVPEAPEKLHYKFVWEEFEFEKTQNQIVTGKYIPVVYTVTYMVDDDIFAKVTYTTENIFDFNEPSVPTKKGFVGKWSDYNLVFEDVTVHAIYSAKPGSSDGGSESENNSSVSESGSANNSAFSDNNQGGSGCSASASAASLYSLAALLLGSVAIVSAKKKEKM